MMMKLHLLLISASLLLATQSGQANSASAKIDGLLNASYKQQGLSPNARVDDATFLRRAYLDVVGRIPTYEETMAFQKSSDPAKRSLLVDQLLNSEGYVHHQFNWWADMLRVKSRLGGQTPGASEYANWIKSAIRENKPYDQTVRDLLTSEGYPRDNPAVGYYLRDNGMPLDNMSNTAQIFLGTRMQCAQCHDHPFDRWTQKEFYEMASYTFGVKTKLKPRELPRFREVYRSAVGDRMKTNVKNRKKRNVKRPRPSPAMRRAYSEIFRPFSYGATDSDRALKLPDDYEYDNAEPNDKVAPHVIFDSPMPKADSDRQSYAKWLTHPDNPRFTTVIVNRLWAQVMGRGLIEPLDDFKDTSAASNPALLDFLVVEMKRLDYDLKAFQRMLFNTDLYQRERYKGDIDPDEAYVFIAPVVRRMSAEQFWDSLMTLAVDDLDGRTGTSKYTNSRYGNQAQRAAVVESKSAKEIVAMAKELVKVQGDYSKQIVAMREEGEAITGQRERKNFFKQRKALQKEINRKTNQILQPGGSGADAGPMMEGQAMKRSRKTKGYENFMVRASELKSPMTPAHPLRQFGQSDREVIDNANREATIPQALYLMNGPLIQGLGRSQSTLYKTVNKGRSIPEKLDRLFVTIMSRTPSEAEVHIMKGQIEKTKKTHLSMMDITWALLNSQQFIFIP